MAARKTPPPAKATGGKPASSKNSAQARSTAKATAAKTGATKAGASTTGAARAGATKAGATKASAAKANAGKVSTSKPARPSGSKGPAQRPPKRRKNKSIVNQKQTPWGLIITAAVLVLFAAAVIGVVVATHKSSGSGSHSVDSSDPYRQPELAAAAKIKGVTYRVEGQHNHVDGHIKYDSSPPVGGNHSPYWADCTGTVYPKAIASENAVHMLEHGAIWITYNAKTLPAAQLTKLKTYVSGIDRMALSPYPNLKTPISLQAWGYQLFVKNASDPRIAEFISALKYNQKTTPEYGATCSQPTFKTAPSTFGHPLSQPRSGSGGNTSGA